jgi:hypothetical protein
MPDFAYLTNNLEFVEVLCYDRGVRKESITFVTDCPQKAKILNHPRYKGVNVVITDYLSWSTNMKFDVIAGNPPYQAPTDNKGAGHALWNRFVEKSFTLLKENGFLCYVHPAGWRRPTGTYKELGKSMRGKQIEYLEIHGIQDGQKTFGVCTRYDWYVLKNTKNLRKTTIKGEDGKISKSDLSDVSCVPNGMFEEIGDLLAKDGEEKINILRSESAYEGRKEWMSKERKGAFQYPCIYSLPQKGMQLSWSSTNQNGHFGIPKVIFSYGAAPQILIDDTGKYGLTQWAFGIVDDVSNLPKIKAAMENPKFIELCKYMRFTLDRYDINFISCFRKDFWKAFV